MFGGTPMPEQSGSQDTLDLVRRSFEAWIRRDLATMRDCMAADFVQWHSHIRRDFTLDEHQAMLGEVLRTTDLHYHEISYLPMTGGVLVRCLCDVRTTAGAAADNIPFGMTFLVRDGKICRCDEYMDGAAIPAITTGH